MIVFLPQKGQVIIFEWQRGQRLSSLKMSSHVRLFSFNVSSINPRISLITSSFLPIESPHLRTLKFVGEGEASEVGLPLYHRLKSLFASSFSLYPSGIGVLTILLVQMSCPRRGHSVSHRQLILSPTLIKTSQCLPSRHGVTMPDQVHPWWDT